MAFDPKPVSLEEYNQSLRDSVNAYYVHAMNDPSMSREEAGSCTAENYLNAVDEFQAAQTEIGTEGEITSGNGTGVEDGIDSGEDLEGGEGCEDGMDM